MDHKGAIIGQIFVCPPSAAYFTEKKNHTAMNIAPAPIREERINLVIFAIIIGVLYDTTSEFK